MIIEQVQPQLPRSLSPTQKYAIEHVEDVSINDVVGSITENVQTAYVPIVTQHEKAPFERLPTEIYGMTRGRP